MDNGYIYLYRKLLKSRVFKNESLLKVWVWCLLKANYKEAWVPVKTGKGETEVHIMPGQFIFGRNSAAKELNMNPTTVRKRILKLKSIGKCDIQSDTHYSIITIIKWSDYQTQKTMSDTQGDRQVTGKCQASDTNNKDNKEKNIKNIYGEFKNVQLKPEEYEKLKSQFGESGTKKRIENLSSYIASKGKKYKSHYATILTWERKNTDTEKNDKCKTPVWL